MAGKRLTIDLFLPDAVYDAIPAAKKTAFRAAVRDMKALATALGEEDSVKATIHTCRHDEGKACDSEVDL